MLLLLMVLGLVCRRGSQKRIEGIIEFAGWTIGFLDLRISKENWRPIKWCHARIGFRWRISKENWRSSLNGITYLGRGVLRISKENWRKSNHPNSPGQETLARISKENWRPLERTTNNISVFGDRGSQKRIEGIRHPSRGLGHEAPTRGSQKRIEGITLMWAGTM